MTNEKELNIISRKKGELDSILDAALDDLADESDDEDFSGNGETYNPLEANTIQTSTEIGKNDSKADENTIKDLDDVANLEVELETMMKQLLIGGSESSTGAEASIMKELNAFNATNGEIFPEKELMDLLHRIENQQQVHENKQNKEEKSQSAKQNDKKKISKSKKSDENNKTKSKASESSKMKKNQQQKSENHIDMGVAKVLQEMAKGAAQENMFSQSEMPNLEAAQMEQMGEELMESMLEEFEKMGQKSDAGDIVDDMMKQLLSKEIMYEPMKKVMELFPAWLATNKSNLSEAEYNKYGQQYQYFQRIVAVYENEPNNFPRLMELMQDIQEFGQPPSDIIRELAPELEFDANGMPKMDLGFGGMMAGMPPLPPGGENCTVM